MNKSYKHEIEKMLGTSFKPSKQQGFQYLALDKNKNEFIGTEDDAQFLAGLMIVIQNSDRQYRCYNKHFYTGMMTNKTIEGKGYKDLYLKLKSLN